MAIEQTIPAYIIDWQKEQERLRKEKEIQNQPILDLPIEND